MSSELAADQVHVRTDHGCRRIAIVGAPGSGKSTIARRLGERLELPVLHLDLKPRSRADRIADVHAIASQPAWITEGIFLGWADEVLRSADVIIWPDQLPWWTALSRILRRFMSGAVTEIVRQPGARKVTRFDDYRYHLTSLANLLVSMLVYYGPRLSSHFDDNWTLTQATTAQRLSHFGPKVIHCTREEDIQALDLTFAPAAGATLADTGADPLVSIVVNNYNYGRFLADAIESALCQTYGNVEVIVVDDGSTDCSRQVISRFGDRVSLVFKENGGQASAFNAGFAQSRGDIVIFLDADDLLLPGTVRHVVHALRRDPKAAKVQYRMEVVDETGVVTGRIKPDAHLPMLSGDLRRHILTFSDDITRMATSGNAFSRDVLSRLLPVPEESYGSVGADWYLSLLAPLLGDTVSLNIVGAYFREHSSNTYERSELDLEQVRQTIAYMSCTRRHMELLLEEQGRNEAASPGPVLDSIAFLAHRMISLKLEPSLHPIAGDSIGNLFVSGLAATRRRFDAPPSLKALFAAWFALMWLSPRPAAAWLASRFLHPARRPRINALLKLIHRVTQTASA